MLDALKENPSLVDRPADAALPQPSLEERLRGMLLAGAVGDALGAPVEFMRREAILARFGPGGIREFAPAYRRLGAITDDTQMTLFTVEGICRAVVRHGLKGICHPPTVVDRAYRRWYATQGQGGTDDVLDGWLISEKALWSARAPGNTCLGALNGSRELGDKAANRSKGAGAVMKTAPIGLMHRQPYEFGYDVAALTHGHQTAQVAAGWTSMWVAQIAAGHPASAAARLAWDHCRGRNAEFDAALARSFDLVQAGGAAAVPRQLGEGWVAEEACAITLWCVLTAEGPFEALCKAVNIDGDSDTTGTMVGHVFGAMLGSDWIPGSLLAALELREAMEALAADAARLLQNADLEEPWVWERYPGW